jgi:pyruvate/2-oxoglutarate dehydrogenase complex dihydrolipoamide acyltransferase (E2) component
VGIGLFGARSVEKWTEMVDPATTFVPVGETVATVSAGGGFGGVPEAWVFRKWATAAKPPAATASAAAQMATITQPRGRFRARTCDPADMPGEFYPPHAGPEEQKS